VVSPILDLVNCRKPPLKADHLIKLLFATPACCNVGLIHPLRVHTLARKYAPFPAFGWTRHERLEKRFGFLNLDLTMQKNIKYLNPLKQKRQYPI
jgi:hypothetical protein